MLAEEFGVDHSTIVRHLQKLGKVWKRCGWVPHELTQQNKDNRVTTFTALLERHEQRPFLHHLITGDEKWILFRNFKRKKPRTLSSPLYLVFGAARTCPRPVSTKTRTSSLHWRSPEMRISV
uniref:Transposase n=1 Tax=Ditylenchus dipsaci TaxID=166011 RepID=A0A915CQQ2_9BILA